MCHLSILVFLFRLLFFSLVVSLFSVAAEKPTPWTAPHFSLTAREIHDQASSLAPPEGTDVSVLNDEDSYAFDANGRSVYTE